MGKTTKTSIETNPMFTWQETRPGLVVIVLFDLIIAYIFASLALNTGSLLQWTATIIFLALAIGQSVKLVRKLFGKKHG